MNQEHKDVSGASLSARAVEERAAACTHMRVDYDPLDVGGSHVERWRCRLCGRQFIPGSLADVRLLVAAERERCAKLAEAYAQQQVEGVARAVANSIALGIRNPEIEITSVARQRTGQCDHQMRLKDGTVIGLSETCPNCRRNWPSASEPLSVAPEALAGLRGGDRGLFCPPVDLAEQYISRNGAVKKPQEER